MAASEELDLHLRSFDRSSDIDAVRDMCKHVYGGRDYLPGKLTTHVNDEHCSPFVLGSTNKVVIGFIQARFLSAESSQYSQGWWYIEAVRVTPKMRNRGVGTAMVHYAMNAIRSQEKEKQIEGYKKVHFRSVTEPCNKAMWKVFQNTGWTVGSLMHVWPEVETKVRIEKLLDDGGNEYKNMNILDAVNIGYCKNNVFSGSWSQMQGSNHNEISSVMEHLNASWRPGFFSAEPAARASNFLTEHATEKESRSVWRLNDDRKMPKCVLFVREKPVDMFPNCPDYTVGACGVRSVEVTEDIVRFVVLVLKFRVFNIIFDHNTKAEIIDKSEILSSLRYEPFNVFEHRGLPE